MAELTDRERAILVGLATTLFPPDGPIPVDGLRAGVPETFLRYLGGFSSGTRRALRLALHAMDASALVSKWRRRFVRLDSESRTRYLEQAVHARLWRRLPLLTLKHLCTIAYCEHPAVIAAIESEMRCLDPSPAAAGPLLHPVSHPELRGNVERHVDVCVVGSGAGGAVIAKELAEAGCTVAVVEEGGYFTNADFSGPIFGRVQRLYRDQGTTAALGFPPIPLPVGKAVGGTTVVNSGTCFRTPPAVLEAWARDYGLDDLDPDAMATRFARVEDVIGARPAPWELLGKNASTFHQGVQALGLHGSPIVRNITDCHGCGTCAFGCPSDAKQAMHLSYLPRAEGLGAVIYARCRVERLMVERAGVCGVEATILDASERPRGRLRIRARLTVLAAGALHTPLLLRRSALARSRHLGRHLRIHPALAIAGVFREAIHPWRGTLQSYYVDDLLASDRVMLEVTAPTPGLTTGLHPAVGRPLQEWLLQSRYLVSVGLFVADLSEGRVGGTRAPLVSYQLNAVDTQQLVKGIDLASRILFAAGAETVYTGIRGRSYVASPRAAQSLLDAGIRPSALTVTGWHPMGTCRMSRSPEDGVVDPSGGVFGAPGLYVADGSVLPTCPGVNPQVTIMAMATRTAEHLIANAI